MLESVEVVFLLFYCLYLAKQRVGNILKVPLKEYVLVCEIHMSRKHWARLFIFPEISELSFSEAENWTG